MGTFDQDVRIVSFTRLVESNQGRGAVDRQIPIRFYESMLSFHSSFSTQEAMVRHSLWFAKSTLLDTSRHFSSIHSTLHWYVSTLCGYGKTPVSKGSVPTSVPIPPAPPQPNSASRSSYLTSSGSRLGLGQRTRGTLGGRQCWWRTPTTTTWKNRMWSSPITMTRSRLQCQLQL